MRSRGPLLIAAAALVGALLWLALAQRGPRAVGAPPTAAAGAPEERPAVALAAPAVVEARETAQNEATPVEASPDPVPAVRWILEGRVVGAEPSDWSAGGVIAEIRNPWRVGAPSIGAPLRAEGRFALELAPLVASPQGRQELAGQPFHVRLVHPELVADAVVFGGRDVRDRRAADGALEHVIAVELDARAGVVLIGKVTSPPLESGPTGARRADVLFVAPASAPEPFARRAGAPVGPDGRFRLEVPVPAGGLVEGIVLAVREAYLPLALPFGPVGAGEHDLGELVLGCGATLAGVLEPAGAPASIDVYLADEHVARDYPEGPIGWLGATPTHARVFSWTQGEGRFAVTGLAPARYALEIARDGRGTWCRMDALRKRRHVVQAPAEGLVLADTDAVVHLHVTSGGRPLGKARVRIENERLTCAVDPEGRIELFVVEDADLVLVVSAEGYVERALAVRTPSLGGLDEREVELAPAVTGELVLIVSEAAGGAAVEQVLLEFPPEPGARVAPRKLSHAPDGRHETGPLSAGTRLVRISPCGPWNGFRSRLVPVELALEVQPNAVRTLPIALELGGQIELEARGPGGELVGPWCEVLDAAGGRHRVDQLSLGDDGGLQLVVGAFSGAASFLAPAFAPGEYELDVIDSRFRPLRVPFRIEAGRDTRIALELDAGD